ncbi:hypothetical protein OESDEN_07056 [Oesophagostomum dentatum]|uniref:Uncharacterized protein n=1 Tax=Oesophagostomum dentatum TaxID=61180 RepID=A0A0B1T643_OESDE|nr:hypothetical protein OESDEN_07056 [Oesophagostomum dentatum]
MAAKEENGVKEAHKTDLWRSNNTCVICQDLCPTREDKDKHENQTKHKKKLLVYEFFAKEVPKFGPFSGSSILVKRYTSCGEQAIGLECLHELHFSFSSQPWWACSICYESGALMEQADMHLTSMSHITTYLDEFHSTKTGSLQMDGDRLKVFEDIKQLCDGIFEEQGGEMLPPECLVMDSNITEKDAMAKLGVDAERLKPSYRLHTDCTNEAHPRKILQCLTISHPVEMFRVSQYAREARLKKVLEMLSNPKFCFDNEQSRRVHADWFPKNLEIILKPEAHEFPAFMPELTPLGIDSKCLFCNVCVKAIRVEKDVKDEGEAVWNSHCAEQSHFDFADGKEQIYVQTQGDVGLEYVVDDQENQEVVCTLCACWFPRGMDQDINNHIRSYQHLNHYLHATNRNLLSMVMVQKTEEASRELSLEWLKRSIHHDMDEMRVYSPEMSLRMKRWGMIPVRKIEMCNYDSTHRPVVECLMNLLDTVAADGAEKMEVPIKEALSAGGVKVHALKQRNGNIERILCRCTHCELAFSTPIEDIVSNIWDRHLASDQHFARIRALMATKLDMLGFSESTSSYTVKPFKQQDPSRKVTWQWNAKDKTHEFVLNVIGLEDLVERRSNEVSGPHPPDFFCRLCAVVIPRRSAALEAHVRSAQHILCYVHKYHPLTIMELDSLPKEGGKEMRKMLAQLLKDHELKEPYCIPIYDPIGEQERKGIVAMQKAKEEERQRLLAEARLKAQEQRKKKDEERRKQREIEMEQEKVRQAERARREKEARERARRLEEEKAHVKKLLQEAARKAEEERKAKEAREQAKEEAERQKRQEHLRSLLDREKARLRALQEKEAAQRRLLAEKQELEKKMRELQERAAVQNQPQRPPVQNQPPQNQLPPRNGPSPYANIPEPQLVAPNMRPPLHSNNGFNVPQEPTRQPLLGHAPPMMQGMPHMSQGPVPPPSHPYGMTPPPVREPFENLGPKPQFPKFVPVAEQVPVYKGLEDAEKATRSKPKSPSPEKPKSGIRPSLLERRVDPYISNAKIIQSRDQLVDFIWRQGAERIPSDELPVQFNEKAAGIEGALGVDCLYEVVCADCPDLDTFYCSMCGVWTTPSEMFKHLETVGHKLAYLFRNYKMYHQTVVSETNSLVREAMLSQFAIQIWKMEQPPGQVCNRLRSLLDRATIERIWPEHMEQPPGQVCNRLRSLLDRATIERIWPEHVKVLDQSWKEDGKTVGRVEVPPPISKEAWSFVDSDSSADDKKEKEKKFDERKIKKEILEKIGKSF